MAVKLIITDEVNCKFSDLPLDERKHLSNKFKFDVPGAKYTPAVRLGRWDGKVSYFSLGGQTYVKLLEDIIPYIYDRGLTIELEDLREYNTTFEFAKVTEDSLIHKTWPAKHALAGKPIVLRDYQIDAINKFLENPQSLQSISTGAGKCRTYDTPITLHCDNNEFNKFISAKIRASMTVESLCSKYQRKMWRNMISRKKLKFSIWDALEYAQETVYYMPYSGIHRFAINTRYCLKCNAELSIGFRKNEFIASTCECSADGKKYMSIEKLSSLFTNEESNIIFKTVSLQKTSGFANRIAYWINNGLSDGEAAEMVTKVQKDRSSKSPASKPGARGYSTRTPEYWEKKGYTQEDAVRKVSEIQVANGLDWYIAQHGEIEGTLKYNERIARYKISYKAAELRDPTISTRKMVKFCNASKQSLTVFQQIYDKYKDHMRIYLGVDGNKEYYLNDGTSIYFYDFAIPELKIIVEYNGSAFHPNLERLTPDEVQQWTCLFSRHTANEVIAYDTAKRQVAINKGFDIVVIWDADNIASAINKIEDLIRSKL